MVRYAPRGAQHGEQCTDGDSGYVLHGQLSCELDGGDRLDAPDILDVEPHGAA